MLEWIQSAPVIVKVFGSLAAILLVNRFSRKLAFSVLAGTVILAAWTGHSPSSGLAVAGKRLVSTDNIFLLVTVFAVIWLSGSMAKTGMLDDLLKYLRARISKRASLALIPAAVGLLPMPGGAIFSAPLVDGCDGEGRLVPEHKVRINYWFRHVWEYWWPLYPGVLLAMDITGLEVWQFALLGIPMSLVYALTGRLFFLGSIDATPPDKNAVSAEDVKQASFFSLTAPVFIVVITYTLVRIGYSLVRASYPSLPEMNRYLPMVSGVCLATVYVLCRRGISAVGFREVVFSPRTVSMAVIVAAVRVYGAFIETDLPATGVRLVQQMHLEMHELNVPVLMVVALVPFVAGVTTGLAVGFVGASFPVVVALLGADPEPAMLYSTVVLAYGAGHMGQILSPVHVCLIVTNQHFKTGIFHSLKGLVGPGLVMLSAAFGMHFFVRWLLGG